jgi:hypothetical protein
MTAAFVCGDCHQRAASLLTGFAVEDKPMTRLIALAAAVLFILFFVIVGTYVVLAAPL